MKSKFACQHRRLFPCALSIRLSAGSLAAVMMIVTGTTGMAASLIWDGGSGTWDANTTANWLVGAASSVWPATGADNDAVFTNSAETITVDPAGVAANDLLFTATGYTLTGPAIITLNGTAPTVTLGSGITATIGNGSATILAGSAGLTKAGAGVLSLSGSEPNTLTGGVTVSGGTLALTLNNLATPTDLINSGNALTLKGGTLAAFCKGGAYNSSQTLAGTAVFSGTSTATVNNNGATSMTLDLGTISQTETGGVLCCIATNGGTLAPNTTTQIVKASNPINAFIGPWAVAGDSKGTTGRWAYVNPAAQVVTITGTLAGANLSAMTSPVTVYTMTGNHTLAADQSGFALQDNDDASNSTTLGNFSITTNGLSQIRAAGRTRSILQGAGGTGRIIVGASNQLVAMGVGNLTVAVPIANGVAGNSDFTYAGGGTLLLKAASTFSGQTTVNSGTVQLDANGSINSSSVIRVNGGRFVQTNPAAAVTPVVNLTGGTLDGTGTVNAVAVSDLPSNRITNGNGTAAALTIGGLAFDGDAGIDIRTAGAAGVVVTNTLTTTPAKGVVTVNVASAPGWVVGTTYNLISYGSWSGSISDFQLGTVPGLGARQTATLGSTGATNGSITLAIGGDNVVWTGRVSANWTPGPDGNP